MRPENRDSDQTEVKLARKPSLEAGKTYRQLIERFEALTCLTGMVCNPCVRVGSLIAPARGDSNSWPSA
jgi:hypothetical protein